MSAEAAGSAPTPRNGRKRNRAVFWIGAVSTAVILLIVCLTTIRLTHRSTNDAEQFPQQEVSTADDDFATKAQSVIVALLDAYERGDQSDVLNFSCDGLHDEFAQQSPREFAEQAKNDVDRRGLALFWGTETTDLTDRGGTLVAYIRYLGDDKDPDKKGRPVLFGLKNTDRWRVCAIRPLNQ